MFKLDIDMKNARYLFELAQIPIEGNESLFERAEQILGDKRAKLSVDRAMKAISWSGYVEQYDEQAEILLTELRDYQKMSRDEQLDAMKSLLSSTSDPAWADGTNARVCTCSSCAKLNVQA